MSNPIFHKKVETPDKSKSDLSGVCYSALMSGIVNVTTVPPLSPGVIFMLPPHIAESHRNGSAGP